MDSVLEWIREHEPTPNHPKTKLLSPGLGNPYPPTLASRVTISPPVHLLYLGVILSSKLIWSEHVTTICKAAKRQIGFIHWQLHQAPVDVRRKIVHTAILPKLEYCAAVWDPHLMQDIAKLDSVQKFSWSVDIANLQSTLRWSPSKTRRRNIKLKVLYDILNIYSRIPQMTFTYHPHPSPVTHTIKNFFNLSFPHSLIVIPSL